MSQTTQSLTLRIQGMSCHACANRIEKVLNKKDFIESARVNFAGETAHIVYHNTQIQPNQIIEIINQTGFQADFITFSPQIDTHSEKHSAQNPFWKIILLMILTAPFMVGMLGMLWGTHLLMPPIWAQILIASVVQGYFALPFYRGAVASLRAGTSNMDVLVSLGTVAIYVYSVLMVMSGHGHHQVYFEAGVMVIAFVSWGKFWEARTKKGSLNALAALLQLMPRDVTIFKNNQWVKYNIQHIQIGDVLRGVHGERIAADGEVVAGTAWADESHLTGESQAVYKTVGSKVLAGSVISGSVDYRAEHLGQDTLLGDMMTALNEAQGSQAPIARLADKVAAIFVPLVLLISFCTLILNGLILGNWGEAWVRAVAVLVVACPCALGLATPAALMVGMGVAVQRGVWFKNAAALEKSGAIRAIVLDKTGTITQGKPQIGAIWTAEHIDENQVLNMVAAAEQHATHPLANAFITAATQRALPPLSATHINTLEGEGIVAHISGVGEVKVGKPEFCGFRLPEHLAQDPIWQIASIVAVSVNGQMAGAFALTDVLKPDSAAVVAKLREHNHSIYVLSGDRRASVAHIAQQLNLPDECVFGEQSPRDKSQFIQNLQSQNQTVAMVGDGINDAPALALADVGFAVRGSTHIAEHSADAVLVQASLQQLHDGLLIARATVKTIRQNLFFAFIYNILAMPVAAMGWLTPALAGMMMAMSSVSVLCNALRLKHALNSKLNLKNN